MQINSINAHNNYILTSKQQILNQKNKTQNATNSSPFVAYPQNYYVSFKARDFATDFETFKDTEMPSTVRDYVENYQLLSSDSEFKVFISRGLKDVQRMAFAALADCKTVEDIKAKYPNEEDFKDLKPLNELETKSKFFSKMQQLERSGVKTLSCDEDVVTFLVKKVYYEGKTYKDVMEDLKAVITPEAGSLKEQLESYTMARGTFFLPIGLKVPNGVTYGSALQGSDPNAFRDHKPFKNLTPEQVTEKIQKLLTHSEKSRYSMMDAWNHCEEARFDLSKFLTENYNNPAFFSSLSDKQIDIFDGKFYSKQRNLMIGFWKKYPQHKETLGKEIKIALERFDKFKAMDSEKFEEYKKSVEERSQEIRDNIQFSKVDVKKEFPNAVELLTLIAHSANPMNIKSETANNDFAQLLLSKTRLSEFETLQGDENSPQYRELIPDGIKEKMRGLLKTPEYTNLANSQNIAVLQNLIEESILSKEDIDSIIVSKKPLNEIIKEIANGTSQYTKGRSINLQGIDNRYDNYKQKMSSVETEKVKDELLKYNPDFKAEDTLKLDVLLTTQGKYLKTVIGESYVKELTQTLFWNEFDRINGTNYSTKVINNIKLDKTIEEAIQTIDSMDFSDITGIDW